MITWFSMAKASNKDIIIFFFTGLYWGRRFVTILCWTSRFISPDRAGRLINRARGVNLCLFSDKVMVLWWWVIQHIIKVGLFRVCYSLRFSSCIFLCRFVHASFLAWSGFGFEKN